MRKETSKLIADLASDLEPEPTSRWRLTTITVLWLCLSAAYVVVATLVQSPLRTSLPDDITHLPFVLEMAAGVMSVVLLGAYSFRLSIPGVPIGFVKYAASFTLSVWISLIAFAPALTTSMADKRPHCAAEALILSTPPMIGLLLLIFRRYPLATNQTLFVASSAAGLMPAVMMQAACMYETNHALMFHVFPATWLIAGIFALAYVLRKLGIIKL